MKKPVTSTSLWHRLGHLPATLRLAAGAVVGVVAWALSPAHYATLSRFIIAWDAFALTALALIWLAMNTADAARIRAVAAKEDLSRLLSFV
ncbi:MAG: hypothetical protein ACRYFV_17455, partial [Janthinobacterium lividum]